MLLVPNLQSRGVVPLESTRLCTTLTTCEQHKTQSFEFFRALTNLTYTYPEAQKHLRQIYE